MKLITYLSVFSLLTLTGVAQTVTSTNLQTYSPVKIEGTISTEGPTVSTTTSRVTNSGTITTISTNDTTGVTRFGNGEVIQALLSGSTTGTVPTQGYSLEMITESDTDGNIVSQGLYLVQGATSGSSSTSATSTLISGSGAAGFSLPQFANYVTASRQTVDTSGSTSVFTNARSSSNGIGTMTVFGDSLYFVGADSSVYGTYTQAGTVYPYAAETVNGEFSGVSGSTIIQGTIQIGQPCHFRMRGHSDNDNGNNTDGAIFGLTEGNWQFVSQSNGNSQDGNGNDGGNGGGWWGGGRSGGGWWDGMNTGGNWGGNGSKRH